jgi:protein-disulfide isomerase
MSKTVFMSSLIAIAAAGGMWWYAGQAAVDQSPVSIAAEAQEASTSSEASRVPDMILGQADAPLTVTEYASFTCPHCANFHATVWDQFKKNYIDTGKVKFIYREVYFDKFGLWGAMVARCGGPEKYFGIADMLYDEQRDWLASNDPAGIADALRKVGLKAGLTKEAVDACLADQDMAKAMVAVYQTNATNDKIEGTPSFIVDGELLSGEMSYEEFAKKIDAKLAK